MVNFTNSDEETSDSDKYNQFARVDGVRADMSFPVVEALANNAKEISSLQNRIKDVEKALNTAMETVLEKANKNIKDEKTKILETLGLFVTFITFISANISAFAKVESFSILVLFMFLFLVCIIFFLFMLNQVLYNTKIKSQKLLKYTFFIFIIGVSGVVATYFIEKNIVVVPIKRTEIIEIAKEEAIRYYNMPKTPEIRPPIK